MKREKAKVSDKSFTENQATHFVTNTFVFRKLCRLRDNYEKFGRPRQARVDRTQCDANKIRFADVAIQTRQNFVYCWQRHIYSSAIQKITHCCHSLTFSILGLQYNDTNNYMQHVNWHDSIKHCIKQTRNMYQLLILKESFFGSGGGVRDSDVSLVTLPSCRTPFLHKRGLNIN